MTRINLKLTPVLVIVAMLFMATGNNVYAQKKQDETSYEELETKQDKNEERLVRIYEMVSAYPDFSYEYVYTDEGELDKVIVEGVDSKADKAKLEVWLYDFKKNKIDIKNIPTRTGIYYAVDQKAEPEGGMKTYMKELHENLNYPTEAEEKGVEGTVYVKFVVDAEGDIPFAKVDEDIATNYELAVSQMSEEARKAVMETSGDWEPAEVNGKDVASWVIVPVRFNFNFVPGMRVIF